MLPREKYPSVQHNRNTTQKKPKTEDSLINIQLSILPVIIMIYYYYYLCDVMAIIILMNLIFIFF